MRVMGVIEGSEEETWFKDIFNEIINGNFPNLEKEIGNNAELLVGLSKSNHGHDTWYPNSR